MVDYDLYKNIDGTYTSPHNNRIYKSKKAFIAHWHRKDAVDRYDLNDNKFICKFCNKSTNKGNINKHENNCYLNPVNLRLCIVCQKPIKNYKGSKGTCSYACSNKHFRSGENNGNWNPNSYQSTCWLYHKKECVECGETNIVAVHHFDENHNNNDPKNLVPLCPTHHQYMHSRYRHLIEDKVKQYVSNYDKRGVAQSGSAPALDVSTRVLR